MRDGIVPGDCLKSWLYVCRFSNDSNFRLLVSFNNHFVAQTVHSMIDSLLQCLPQVSFTDGSSRLLEK